MKSLIKNTKVWLGVAGICVLASAIPFALPDSFYLNQLEKRLEDQTGLNADFSGKSDVTLFPNVSLRIDGLTLSGEAGLGLQVFGQANDISVDMGLFELISGKVHIDRFLIDQYELTINGDFTPYVPDWLREKLQAARKADVRYAELARSLLEEAAIEHGEIKKATIFWNKTKDISYKVDNLNLVLRKPRKDEDLTLKGQGELNNREVDLALRLQRPDEFMRGFRSALDIKLLAGPLNAIFKGDSALRTSFIAQGNLNVDIPSQRDFCIWLMAEASCEQQSGSMRLKSDLKLRDQRLQIDEASFLRNKQEYRSTGYIDFKTHLPDIHASILLPVNEDATISKTLENLTTLNFNNLLIETYNANIEVKHAGVKVRPGELITPKWRLIVEDARLTATLEPLRLLNGVANLSFKWDSTTKPGKARMRGSLENIDLRLIETGIPELLDLRGNASVEMEMISSGTSLNEFLSTPRLSGSYQILDGQIANSEIIQALKGPNAKDFEFTEVHGGLTGAKGEIRLPDITFIAPATTVDGQGMLDLASQSVNLHLVGQYASVDKKNQNEITHGFVLLDGPLSELSLVTSLSDKNLAAEMNGLHSGLIEQDTPGNDILDE